MPDFLLVSHQAGLNTPTWHIGITHRRWKPALPNTLLLHIPLHIEGLHPTHPTSVSHDSKRRPPDTVHKEQIHHNHIPPPLHILSLSFATDVGLFPASHTDAYNELAPVILESLNTLLYSSHLALSVRVIRSSYLLWMFSYRQTTFLSRLL